MGKNCPRCTKNCGQRPGCPAPAGSSPPLLARDLMRNLYELVLNLRAAHELGLRLPGALLVRADRLIE